MKAEDFIREQEHDCGNLFKDWHTEKLAHEMERYAQQRVNEVLDKQWISVKDRLPEDGRDVIIYTNKKQIQIAYLDSSYWMGYDYSGEISMNATHWMELPEPLKKTNY